MKRLSAQAIGNKLVTVLALDVIGYSMMTKYRRQRQFPSIPSGPSEECPRKVVEHTTLDPLEKQPLFYICQLAQLTCIPTTMVHQHLTQLPEFVVKHLRWLPHSLAAT